MKKIIKSLLLDGRPNRLRIWRLDLGNQDLGNQDLSTWKIPNLVVVVVLLWGSSSVQKIFAKFNQHC